jgi:hypothetical protein
MTKKYSIPRIIVFLFIISMFYNIILLAQISFRGGLIKEDLSKIPWIKKVKKLGKKTMLPASIDLSSRMPPVRNQGSQESCVGWALGYYYKTYQEWQEHGWDISTPEHQFSPAFIYNHINGGVDKGCLLSEAFEILLNHGCAPLSDMPYLQSNFIDWPSEEAYTKAIPYRCFKSYFFYLNSQDAINELKNLLEQNNLAVLSLDIYDNLRNIERYNYNYCSADFSGKNGGSHVVTIVGYDDNRITNDGKGAFKCINSWGENWGYNGFFWISYQAIINPNYTQVAAYITDRINYSPTILVKTKITHNIRGRVDLSLGFKINGDEYQRKSIFGYGRLIGKDENPFPKGNIVLDFSEIDKYIDSTKENSIFIKCSDLNVQNVTGTIDYLSIIHERMNKIYTSHELPQEILHNPESNTIEIKMPPLVSIIKTNDGMKARKFNLMQNYPNPFNSSTVFCFELPFPNFVTLRIYDLWGEEIKTLINKALNSGRYSINFIADELPAGIYFYKLNAGSYSSVKKMIYLK